MLSQKTDPKAGAHVLEFLDVFALTGYNSSLGQVSNDDFSKRRYCCFMFVNIDSSVLNHVILLLP